MPTCRLVLVAVPLLLSALAPATAAQDLPLVSGSITFVAAQDDTPWIPSDAVRTFPLAGTVTCGNRDSDAPSYDVALRVANAPASVTAFINPNAHQIQFSTPRCLAGGPNATQRFYANLTASARPDVDAFARLPIWLNASLARDGQAEPFDGAETSTNLTVGYGAGLHVQTPANVQGLVDDRTRIELVVNNTANGPSAIAGQLLNGSATLTVDFPAAFTLNRSEARLVRLSVASTTGCSEAQRSFQVRFTGASTDPRGTQTADWLGTFVVNCQTKKRVVPSADATALSLAAMALLAAMGRRGVTGRP